eukprot:g11056.t1
MSTHSTQWPPLHRAPLQVPGGFKDYKANGKSFGVMTMLQQLVDDAAAMEAEAVRAEKSAQSAYEAFAKDTTVSIAKKDPSIMNKKAHKAKLEQTLVQTRQSREGHERELETLEGKKMDLHESCDWLLKNFDARQSAREEDRRSRPSRASTAIRDEKTSVG